ncbi:citrate/2-methylcitrate synthase, partial [Bacillus pumilus]
RGSRGLGVCIRDRTFTARVCVATLSDIYSGVTAAIGALKGPLHGGANEGVMKMLSEIGEVENVDSYIHGKLETVSYTHLEPRDPL